MSGREACALLLLLAPSAEGQEAAETNAFIEVATDPASPFVGEPLSVTVRFGFTADFLRDHVVPLFAQPLDLEAQLDLPWLADLPGTRARERGASVFGTDRLRCALNDGVATVLRIPTQRDDERNFQIFELVRGYLPERAGTLTIPAPVLRFAWAAQFEDDLLRGRVAVDRSVAVVRGNPLEVTIVAPPEEGRPAGFCGAVGSMRIRAEVADGARPPDGCFRLTVTIEGRGNLEAFSTPAFPELDLFHRVGTLEAKESTRRTITCDLKERGTEVQQVPALAFTYFDPKSPAGYRTVHTEPIALEPAPDHGAAATPRASTPVVPTTPANAPSRGRFLPIVVAVAFAGLLALVVVQRLSRRTEGDADALDARARHAAATFAERARAPGADLGEALADYLAAHLETSPAAVISPALPALLRARGLAPELAARTAATLQAQVAARYGAGRSEPEQEVPLLVRELEAAFAAATADRSTPPPRR